MMIYRCIPKGLRRLSDKRPETMHYQSWQRGEDIKVDPKNDPKRYIPCRHYSKRVIDKT